MALVRINAESRKPVLHGADERMSPILEKALRAPGPITIMVHGYKFLPTDPAHCPHLHIFAEQDVACSKAISWPKHLGYLADHPQAGVCFPFGWNARGTFKQALRAAFRASDALARLIKEMRTIDPLRPVNLIAHSMGAYVALNSLHRLERGAIGRIILLNGAVFRPCTAAALRTNAGRDAELFNIISRENAPYDTLFERMVGRRGAHDRTIGRGFEAPNALTLRLDDKTSLNRLADLGHRINPSTRWFCHWSPYLRPGAMSFYNALLRTPQELPLYLLQNQLTPRRYLPSVRASLNSGSCSAA